LCIAGEADGGGLAVRLGGELDIASLPDVAAQVDALLATEPQRAVLDLAELQFMDSTGVAVLLRLAHHFAPLEVRHATPAVRRVVQALGLGTALGLQED
jgi:anti-sigma B factor antagonist